MTATSVLTAERPSAPVPAPDPTVAPGWSGRLFTAAVVVIPVAAVAWAAQHFWHHGIGWFDLVLAVVLYAITGHGIALGFHRLLTHRSFKAHRWLRITLAVCGSMAMEGSVISWVSHHRRHHVFADQPGDPHSPTGFGPGFLSHWKYFVVSAQGAKHLGSAEGPDTTFWPAAHAEPETAQNKAVAPINIIRLCVIRLIVIPP